MIYIVKVSRSQSTHLVFGWRINVFCCSSTLRRLIINHILRVNDKVQKLIVETNHCRILVNITLPPPSICPHWYFQWHVQNWAWTTQFPMFDSNCPPPLTFSNSNTNHHHHLIHHTLPTPSTIHFNQSTWNWAPTVHFQPPDHCGFNFFLFLMYSLDKPIIQCYSYIFSTLCQYCVGSIQKILKLTNISCLMDIVRFWVQKCITWLNTLSF